jgi:hypothetical protein
MQTEGFGQRPLVLSTSTSYLMQKARMGWIGSRVLTGTTDNLLMPWTTLIVHRYNVPDEESFRGPILDDEFEIDTAKSEDEKQLAISAKSSKIWRALRIASKTKLNLFDRIEDGQNLEVLFKADSDGDKAQVEIENLRDSGDGKAGETPNKREGTGQETFSPPQLMAVPAPTEEGSIK